MLSFVTDALATYRLTRLAITDEITERPRKAFRNWALDHRWRWLYDLSSCPWCLGWWIAVGVVIARKVAPRAWTPVATALAMSAVTGILAEET